MQNRNRAKRNTGFTLVEMLIVVAIIAILVAVSIPLVSSSLENARDKTDLANERSAKAEAAMVFLGVGTEDLDYTSGSAGVFYYDAESGKLVTIDQTVAPYGKCSTEHGEDLFAGESGSQSAMGPHDDGIILVTIESDGLVSLSWMTPGDVDAQNELIYQTWKANQNPSVRQFLNGLPEDDPRLIDIKNKVIKSNGTYVLTEDEINGFTGNDQETATGQDWLLLHPNEPITKWFNGLTDPAATASLNSFRDRVKSLDLDTFLKFKEDVEAYGAGLKTPDDLGAYWTKGLALADTNILKTSPDVLKKYLEQWNELKDGPDVKEDDPAMLVDIWVSEQKGTAATIAQILNHPKGTDLTELYEALQKAVVENPLLTMTQFLTDQKLPGALWVLNGNQNTYAGITYLTPPSTYYGQWVNMSHMSADLMGQFNTELIKVFGEVRAKNYPTEAEKKNAIYNELLSDGWINTINTAGPKEVFSTQFKNQLFGAYSVYDQAETAREEEEDRKQLEDLQGKFDEWVEGLGAQDKEFMTLLKSLQLPFGYNGVTFIASDTRIDQIKRVLGAEEVPQPQQYVTYAMDWMIYHPGDSATTWYNSVKSAVDGGTTISGLTAAGKQLLLYSFQAMSKADVEKFNALYGTYASSKSDTDLKEITDYFTANGTRIASNVLYISTENLETVLKQFG